MHSFKFQSSLLYSNRHPVQGKVGQGRSNSSSGAAGENRASLLALHDVHYVYKGEGEHVYWILDDGGRVEESRYNL